MSKEVEDSGFTSDGRTPFPPIHEDLKDMSFVDEHGKWPTKKLLGRIAWYTQFLNTEKPMPRAYAGASHLLEHMMFEALCREGFYSNEGVEDAEQDDSVL